MRQSGLRRDQRAPRGLGLRRGFGSVQTTIVYLHGIGDNRDSSIGVIDRFLRRGFSVFVFTPALIDAAFVRAEDDADFVASEVSPLRAAATLTIPVFIIHGALDRGTLPIHSQRVYDAIRGRKKLLLVPGAGHNDALRGDVWNEIEQWLEQILQSSIDKQIRNPLDARSEIVWVP